MANQIALPSVSTAWLHEYCRPRLGPSWIPAVDIIPSGVCPLAAMSKYWNVMRLYVSSRITSKV